MKTIEVKRISEEEGDRLVRENVAGFMGRIALHNTEREYMVYMHDECNFFLFRNNPLYWKEEGIFTRNRRMDQLVEAVKPLLQSPDDIIAEEVDQAELEGFILSDASKNTFMAFTKTKWFEQYKDNDLKRKAFVRLYANTERKLNQKK